MKMKIDKAHRAQKTQEFAQSVQLWHRWSALRNAQ